MEDKEFVQLVGYVGQDLEESEDDFGLQVAMRLVTYNYVREEGAGTYKTVWHHVIALGREAEYARSHLRKGSHILVEGKVKYGSFFGEDGIEREDIWIRAIGLLHLEL